MEHEEQVTTHGIAQYMKEIARIPLLSLTEEQELAMHIEVARDAKHRLATENVTEREARNLAHVIQRGDDAANKLVQSNMRLVASIAKNYLSSGVDMLDLMQEGAFGLMRAAERYDRRHGARFGTYASWWVTKMIRQSIARDSRTIRIPGHMIDALTRIKKVTEILFTETGRQPTEQEIADRANEGWTADFVSEVLRLTETTSSFDTAMGETEVTLEDVTTDEAIVEQVDRIHEMHVRELVQRALVVLTEREYLSVQLHFGLVDGTPRSHKEIAEFMNVSLTRVYQILKAAGTKLHAALAGVN